MSHASLLEPGDTLLDRHLGSNEAETAAMLATVGHSSLDALVDAAVPAAIRLRRPLDLPSPTGERETLLRLRVIAEKNKVYRSYLGTGYSDTVTPPVILRNIMENPAWYTSYTPYQAEISQGRLEALLNFQTMVTDLTGMEIANASLLDEATAAAEAMGLARAVSPNEASAKFVVSDLCHPQNIEVVRTRAKPLGLEVVVAPLAELAGHLDGAFGLLLQYPATDGTLADYSGLIAKAKAKGVVAVVAADLLALTVLTPPGKFGADVVVGSAQRFGVPPRLRRAARRVLRDAGRVQALDAGPPRRRLEGRAGETRRSASPSRPASSTSAGTRRPATSAPPRPSWRTWRRRTPSTTARPGCAGSPPASTSWRSSSPRGRRRWGTAPAASSSTPSG